MNTKVNELREVVKNNLGKCELDYAYARSFVTETYAHLKLNIQNY